MIKDSIRILEQGSDRMLMKISPQNNAQYSAILEKFVNKVAKIKDAKLRKKSLEYKFGASGNNLLHLAAKFSDEKLVDKLLELAKDNKSYAQITNNDLFTPLHFAAMTGSKFIVQKLISLGAKIDQASSIEKRYWTPSHFAAKYNSFEVMKLFIEQGSDKEIKTSFGLTPLAIAAEFGALEVVNLLLKSGAKVNIETNEESHKMTALHYAVIGNNEVIVDNLLKANIDFNALTSSNLSAIEFAAERNSVNIVQILLSYGVERWESALEIAKNNNAEEVIEIINEYNKAKSCLFSENWVKSNLSYLISEISQFNKKNLHEPKIVFGNNVKFNAYALLRLRNESGFFKKIQKTWRHFLLEAALYELKRALDKLEDLADN